MSTKKVGKPRRTVATRMSPTGKWVFICETSSLCEILVSNVDKVNITWEHIYKLKKININEIEWNFDFISDNTYKKCMLNPSIRTYANGIYLVKEEKK